MASPQYYNARVVEEMKRELSWAITQKLRDPRVPSIITITEITLSPDTRNATVFVSIFDTVTDKDETVKALNHAASFLQKIISQKIKIRHTPKLYFKIDSGVEKQNTINSILDTLRNELDSTK